MSDATQPITPPQPPSGAFPPPAPQTPAPGEPAGRPRKSLFKRWWFWALVVVALIVIASVAASGGMASPDASAGAPSASGSASAASAKPAKPTASNTPKAAAATTPVGTAAKAGDLELTVTQVEPGVAQVGDEFGGTLLGEKAQGQFVLVHLTVKNTGNSPVYFSSGDLPMYDAQGRKFSSDDTASIYIKDNTTLFSEINPGNTLQGVVVYDIPADAQPSTLKYSGSLFGKDAVLALG